MYLVKKSTNMHFRKPQLDQHMSDFQSGFCICVIVDFLTQNTSFVVLIQSIEVGEHDK